MNPQDRQICPDCDTPLDRRRFMRTVGSAALVGAAAPVLLGGRIVQAAPSASSPAENAAARFYTSLSEEQKKAIAFPFDHDLRKKINANWHITKPKIEDDFYTKAQRATIDEIVRNVTTADGYERHPTPDRVRRRRNRKL